MRTISTTLAMLLVLAGHARAQEPDPRIGQFLVAAASAERSSDLPALVDTLTDGDSGADVWAAAVALAREHGDTSIGRALVVRLMEAALLIDGVEPDELRLDELETEDTSAMRASIGFPDPQDLVIRLLDRSPSVREEFDNEMYVAIRIPVIDEGVSLWRERADRPYLDLAPQSAWREIEIEADTVAIADGVEHAKTRRLNLAALPHTVLAAKAFRAAARADPTRRIYPQIIAFEAVNRAYRDDPVSFRVVRYFTEQLTASNLDAAENPDAVVSHYRALFHNRLPHTAFFTRHFEYASSLYASAPLLDDVPIDALWAGWGEAISHLAYGAIDQSAEALGRVVDRIDEDGIRFAVMAGWLLDYLPEDQSRRYAAVRAWRERSANAASAAEAISPALAEALANDFLNIMETIGRPDVAVRFLIDWIEREEGYDSERALLLSLAAFARDLCYSISFAMSADRGWQRRPVRSYPHRLDFLDNVDAEGQLIDPGEVVVSPPGRPSYPMLSPEEDCAAVYVAYGVVPQEAPFDEAPTPPHARAALLRPIEAWVLRSALRDGGQSSLAPLAKVVWIEWFLYAFEALRDGAMPVESFVYRPIGASTLASPEVVEGAAMSDRGTAHQRAQLGLYVSLRRFLERRYAD